MSDVKENILNSFLKSLDIENLISVTILNSLTEEVKNDLIENVLKYLNSKTDNWSKLTVLQQAFNTAIHKIAHDIILKRLNENGQFNKEVGDMIEDAVRKFISLDKNKLVDKFVRSFTFDMRNDDDGI